MSIINGTSANNTLSGTDTDDVINGLAGDDSLYGNGGNDTLTGGLGNDYLSGGEGSDTYIYNLSDGQDTIYTYQETAATDKVVFGAGITASNLHFIKDGSDIVITFNNSASDSIRLKYEFAGDSRFELATLQFDDGSTLGITPATLTNTIYSTGTSGNETMNGYAGTDVISAGAGDDSLYGNAGNDTLTGGLGNDYLSGGEGSDTYMYNLGDGQDTIYTYQATAATDKVVFGAGITADNLHFSKDGTDIVITFNNSVSDSIRLKYQFAGDSRFELATLQFNDGSTLGITQATVTNTIYSTGTSGNDTLNGYAGMDVMDGGAGDDSLYGTGGNDTLIGGTGNDYLSGGAGDDTYYVDSIDDKISDSSGNDTVYVAAGADNFRTAGIENVTYQSADTIKLAYFIDALESGSSWSSTKATAASVSYSFVESSTVTGFQPYTETQKNLVRSVLADYAKVAGLTFTEVTDASTVQIRYFLDKTMNSSSSGYANYPSSSGSEVHIDPGYAGSYHIFAHETGHALGLKHPGNYNAGGGGTEGPYLPTAEDDGVNTNMSYTGGWDNTFIPMFDIASIQYLYGVNTSQHAGNDTYTQNDRYIWDGAGVDTLSVSTATAAVNLDLRAGAWSYVGTKNESILAANQFFIGLGTQIENAIGSQWNDMIRGNAAANTLIGGAGNDTLTGGAGADILQGGVGNDTYILDVDRDTISELVGEGTDTVQSAINYTLVANVENLTFTGSAALNGNGNELNNFITGNSGNNTLSGLVGDDTLTGGAGVDILQGGVGNDTYILDVDRDTITELAGEGTDTVLSAINYTLVANVENLTFTGSAALNGNGNTLDNFITGNSGNNTLAGLAGNDILTGGAGVDILQGGIGNDTYILDVDRDTITELAGEGTDTVLSSINYTLVANVENLTFTGSAALNGNGNELNNFITGNSGNNTLSGLVGNDTLTGGAGVDILQGGVGNDTYILDVDRDTINELVGEGTDTVQSAINYTLVANLENLTFTGSAALNGNGNTLDNFITGNSGNNTLAGLAGNDTLTGGAGVDILQGGIGNDTYILDVDRDTITELAGEGTDTVLSAINYTLVANVENLTLTGTAALNGNGNGLNNVLTGNSGNNILGGFAGNDTYGLGRNSGSDSFVENDATVGNTDILQFANDVRADQIWFRQVGLDLEVDIIGTVNKALIKDWYSGSQYHIEQLKSGDGKMLTDNHVQNLVNAMASLGSTPPATIDLSVSQQTSLNQVFAANWA